MKRVTRGIELLRRSTDSLAERWSRRGKSRAARFRCNELVFVSVPSECVSLFMRFVGSPNNEKKRGNRDGKEISATREWAKHASGMREGRVIFFFFFLKMLLRFARRIKRTTWIAVDKVSRCDMDDRPSWRFYGLHAYTFVCYIGATTTVPHVCAHSGYAW